MPATGNVDGNLAKSGGTALNERAFDHRRVIYKQDPDKFAYQFSCILNRAAKFPNKFAASPRLRHSAVDSTRIISRATHDGGARSDAVCIDMLRILGRLHTAETSPRLPRDRHGGGRRKGGVVLVITLRSTSFTVRRNFADRLSYSPQTTFCNGHATRGPFVRYLLLDFDATEIKQDRVLVKALILEIPGPD